VEIAQDLSLALPTSVEPAKATLSTSGCSASAAPPAPGLGLIPELKCSAKPPERPCLLLLLKMSVTRHGSVVWNNPLERVNADRQCSSNKIRDNLGIPFRIILAAKRILTLKKPAHGDTCGPRSQLASDGAENFLQTSRKRAAHGLLAGEEVRNPTLKPSDRTEGIRPHGIQIEQAAELVFPE
jgi:hypothetical protein